MTDVATNDVGWNGSLTACQRSEFSLLMAVSLNASSVVRCPDLTTPSNGTISCSLINGPLFLYEAVCNFTCNTSYELAGSSIRVMGIGLVVMQCV